MTLLYAYNFDEASGNVLDRSGNGRDTVFAGSLARTASGGGHTDKGMSQSTTTIDSNGPPIAALRTELHRHGVGQADEQRARWLVRGAEGVRVR
jgi:hypothetical protein